MKEDKSLLPFASFDTLAQYQQHRFKKIFKKVYISSKDKNKFDFFNETNISEFIDDITDENTFAPTMGFLSVFKTLGCKRFFAISVDTPFIDEETIKKLYKKDTNEVDATIATLNGKIQPLCGIYHISLEEKFEDMAKQNNHKLGYLLKNSNTVFVNFEDEKIFMNLNNPDEYQKALTLF